MENQKNSDVVAYVAQQENNKNKCYASPFR